MFETSEIIGLPDAPPAAHFDAVAEGERMAKETVVFELHLGRPYFTVSLSPSEFIRKVREAGEEDLTPAQAAELEKHKALISKKIGPNGEVTDSTMLHITQDIIDRKEANRIWNYDDKFVTWVKKKSIKQPMLAAGMYQIQLKHIDEIDAAVVEFVKGRKVLIDEFGGKYLDLRNAAKVRRWPFYDESNYPIWEYIRAKYTIQARYITYNVPAALERLNNDLFKREQEKLKVHFQDAAKMAMDAQRATFLGLNQSFTAMLGTDEVTGKRKVFRPAVAKAYKEYLEMYEEIAFVADPDLAKIVSIGKGILEGVDIEDLKKDVNLRDQMRASVKGLEAQAAELVMVEERKGAFIDDEDDAFGTGLSLED